MSSKKAKTISPGCTAAARLSKQRGQREQQGHEWVPAFAPSKTPPKFHEKTPKRGKKERNMWREREKTRNVGRSGGGRSDGGRYSGG